MTRILISVKEKWAQLILSGRKTVELRRTCPAHPEGMLKPCIGYICNQGHAHGYCFILKYENLNLFNHESAEGKKHIAELQRKACVTPKEWAEYQPKYAWHIGEVVRFPHAAWLGLIEGVRRCPQSWRYLTPLQSEAIRRMGGLTERRMA